MKQRVHAGGTIDTVTTDELATLLQEFGRSGHIAFGSGSIEKELDNWPVMGGRRQIRVVMAHGTNNFIVAANAFTDIVPANNGRGGINIVNKGANEVDIFLATAVQAKDQAGAIACISLAAGASWDGRISGSKWVGDVSCLSVVGTTLAIAEI